MLIRRLRFKPLSMMVCLMLLQGCQDSGMADLKKFVNDAYKDDKPEIEPLPEIQPYKGYEYAASGEQDPFGFDNIASSKDGEAADGSGNRPDSNRRREQLEEYPLDALKMVGTMTKKNQPWVVIRTAEGIAHLATTGNYLGQNEGKIEEILPDEQLVVISETVLDSAGRWITRDVEITVGE